MKLKKEHVATAILLLSSFWRRTKHGRHNSRSASQHGQLRSILTENSLQLLRSDKDFWARTRLLFCFLALLRAPAFLLPPSQILQRRRCILPVSSSLPFSPPIQSATPLHQQNLHFFLQQGHLLCTKEQERAVLIRNCPHR